MGANRRSLAESFRRVFESTPDNGVIGLADSILELCPFEGLRLDWRDNECRIQLGNGNGLGEVSVPFRKAVFRALLARMFALCQENTTGTINP
jgi:hypothetical protein